MSRLDWKLVAKKVIEKVVSNPGHFKQSEGNSLSFIADNISNGGVILADEVGMGKTWVALTLLDCVVECGGTAAVVVPPGLMFQWQAEFHKYKENQDVIEPVLLRSYWGLFQQRLFQEKNPCSVLIPHTRPWTILSHRFNVPNLRKNSPTRRFCLPTLVAAHIQDDEGTRKRRAYQYGECGSYHEDMYPAAKYLADKVDELDREQTEFLLNEQFHLTHYHDGQNARNNYILEHFKRGNMGFDLHCNLIGQLIGVVDLLLIDEAHKSKDSIESPIKLLGTLLEKVIDSHDGRRMAITATPVELGPEQWLFLLERIGKRGNNLQKTVSVINQFSRSLVKANLYSDSRSVLDDLIGRSYEFKLSLEDSLTRRRRMNQTEMKKLIKYSDKKASSHPHRSIEKCVIRYSDLDKRWKNIVLAFEGISKAAKGMDGKRAEKLLRTRYASGHIVVDFNERRSEEVETPENVNPQEGRLLFWKKLAYSLLEEDGTENGQFYSHPRVKRAADRIEEILYEPDGKPSREKVLVFGTFISPLEDLNHLLNARHILRQIDSGRPVLATRIDRALLYREYLGILLDRKTTRPFVGELAGSSLNREGVKRKIVTARRSYEIARDKLGVIDEKFIKQLPGDAAIMNMGDSKSIFLRFLRSKVLNEYLYADEVLEKIDPQNAKKMAKAIWKNYLNAQIEQEDNLDEYEAVTEYEGDEEEKKLDSFGDNMDARVIEEILKEEAGVERIQDVIGPASQFSRLFVGRTDMKTRRAVQAQFNRFGSNPRALISQSLVGREGLNLHEACRHVFLFHPEWNPATVEQQIGRVDRINSYWENLANEYRSKIENGEKAEFPYIIVEFLVFEGTYDEYQYERLFSRRNKLDAQLFGSLLSEGKLEKVPSDMKPKLRDAAPDFEPLQRTWDSP